MIVSAVPPPPPPPPPRPAVPPQGYPSVAYGQPQANGVGLAGGVVGIVALCLFWIPFLDLVLAIVAVALAAVGMNRANHLGGASKGMAITGLVTGIVALLLSVLINGAVLTRAVQT